MPRHNPVAKSLRLKPQQVVADKRRQLLDEWAALDAAYASAGDMGSPLDDEESLEYFDRYIAGDR